MSGRTPRKRMTERTDRGLALLLMGALVSLPWIWSEVDKRTVLFTVVVALLAIWWVVDYVRERRGLIPPSKPHEPELLSRRMLWFSVGTLTAVAVVSIGMGLGILLSPDGLNAATPNDAHWAAGMFLVLGPLVAVFPASAVVTQRRLRRLAASPSRPDPAEAAPSE